MLMQQMAYAFPGVLAVIAGLVMTSVFRQRSPAAANLAMWCLIAMLLNLVAGVVVFGLMFQFISGIDGERLQSLYMAIGLGQQLIDAAATLGLVYAVFLDRKSETDDLPELDDDRDAT